MARNNLLECFTYAYITCALWSSTDDDGNPLDDGRDTDDIAPDAMAKMQRDCAAFYAANAAHIHCEGAPQAKDDPTASESEREAAKAGHDFWLTRNGHGTGFWDGDWPLPYADLLDKAAQAAGTCDLYVGDDGMIYCG